VCVCVNPQQLLASQAHTFFHYTFILLPVPVPIHTTQIPQWSNPWYVCWKGSNWLYGMAYF